MNKIKLTFIIILIVFVISFIAYKSLYGTSKFQANFLNSENFQTEEGGLEENDNPLSIEQLKKGEYLGSDITIEETLDDTSSYHRYIAAYKSERLKIYALLTIPKSAKPKDGFPVIIFNHGYIPPAQYKTTERYVAYVDGFARNGYLVFKPDYRGHGNSEGLAIGGYGSNAYTIDVLNAISSIKKYQDADPERIGIWGHSLGGFITLRSMIVRSDIKAGVIWAGVVASYPDLLNRWRRTTPPATLPTGARRWRQTLVEQFGTPEQNPTFWNSISSNSYLADISGPLQLHHGSHDTSVPIEFSEKLASQLKEVGKIVELYTYSGDDHNLSNNFNLAMKRSIEFFDKYLRSD